MQFIINPSKLGSANFILWTATFTGTVETLDGDIYHIEDGKVVDDEGNVTGTMTVEILTD